MDRAKRISIILVLFYCSTAFSILGQSSSSIEDSLFLPLPRKDPLITYQPIPISTSSLYRLAVQDQKKIEPLLYQQKEISGKEQDLIAKDVLLLPDRPLVGRVIISGNKLELMKGDSIALAIQLIDENEKNAEYRTMAHVFLLDEKPVQISFPGQYATGLRILFMGQLDVADPIAEVQVYKIQLTANTRIMLLGDSITDGKFADDNLGYRKELYNLLLQKGLTIDFVGSYGESPYESHFQGGRKIQDFYPVSIGGTGRLDVTAAMNNYRPNVIAIHLGTNNLADGLDGPIGPYGKAQQFNKTPAGMMATLVNYLLKWNNGNRGTELQYIFLSQIIPIRYQDSLMVVFCQEMARMARDFRQGIITGQPEPVYLVDHFTRFYEDPALLSSNYYSHMADDLHPNTKGHHVMAVTYLNTMYPVLSSQPNWFSDITWEADVAGLDNHFGGQGVAVADVNGDDLEDLYASRIAMNGINRRDAYYENSAKGVFQEKAEALTIQDAGDSRGVLFVDIDNDGDVDLFNANSSGRNRLYDNLQNISFQEITNTSGLENVNAVTTAVLAFDCENDGDLDLYAVNSRTINEFYLNDGRGHFSRKDRGLNDVQEPDIASLSASAADFDGDNDVDVYIAKRLAPNKLFINNGTGFFTEGAQLAGIAYNGRSNSAVWADLDNDGDLDLIISVSSSSSDPNPILHIFKNNGNGAFQDISATLKIFMDGYSPLVGDFDNDGDLDIITTGESKTGAFYRNDGNWVLNKTTETGAEIFAGDVRGGVVFDYDNDGDLDVYVARADVFNVLKRNNLDNGNHYLKVKAIGVNGNGSAIGTKIWIYPSGQLGNSSALIGFREILSGLGHESQYSFIQHFGLGNRINCDLLAQFNDGTLIAQRGLTADRTVVIQPQLQTDINIIPASVQAFGGQNQIDTVGQQLPAPLVARVLNADNQPVPGVRVDFNVTRGAATLITPQTMYSSYWLEAENGRLGGRMCWVLDAYSSNNGFVLMSPLKRNSGFDTLTAEITKANSYFLWLRMMNPIAGGTIYYQIDAQGRQTAAINMVNEWTWIKLRQDGGILLDSGTHRIMLESSLAGLQIDKLLLTADPQVTPTGLGEESGKNGLLTDREGLVRRYLQLGTQAGPVIIEARVNSQTYTVLFYATALPGPAFSLRETSGNHQVGTPDIPLSQPLVVSLYDVFDNPVPGKRVIYKVISGGGTLIPADGRVNTDALGQAKATLVPGRSSSLQQVAAEAEGVVGSSLLFENTVPGIAANLVYIDGNNQADSVNAILQKPVRFKITMQNGNPAANYPVDVNAFSGGYIALTPNVANDSTLKVTSDQNGLVQIYWRLGHHSGEQSLKVEATGLQGSPLIFKATASIAQPSRIFVSDGDGQEGAVASKLAKPLTARVTDRFGNAIPGQAVIFRVTRGAGSFDGSNQYNTLTDANGDAKAFLILGSQAGLNVDEVQATCIYNGKPLAGSPVTFWATARAGAPNFIFVISGDQQTGVVRTILPNPLIVAVKDYYQNAVVGGSVRFAVVKGNGLVDGQSLRNVKTDKNGLASIFFQLGTQAGVNVHELTAEAEGLIRELASFRVSAIHDVAVKLVYQSGKGQAAIIHSRLNDPLCVAVQDRYENSIENYKVQFDIVSSDGLFPEGRQQIITTDADGHACVPLTLGNAIGDSIYVVQASAKDRYQVQPLIGSPVVFHASGLNSLPARLWPVTSPFEAIIGTVGRELSNPIQIRVLDDAGQGVPGIQVEFEILNGEGKFVPDGNKRILVFSRADGSASARWLLGSVGQSQRLSVSASYNGKPIGNSPLYYNAIAVQSNVHQMQLLSGDKQTGMVGQTLGQPLHLRIVDDLGETVSQHPVQFLIHRGGGSLDAAHDTLLLKYSDNQGQVDVQWHLGAIAGDSSQAVKIVSKGGYGMHLQGSPLIILAHALPANPYLNRSSLIARSPVAANGIDSSDIVATIRDQYGNGINNLKVRLLLGGLTALVTPMQGSTDQSGGFRSSAKSRQVGNLTIRMLDATSGVELTTSALISFLAPTADSLERISGNNLTGEVTKFLSEPLTVHVRDVFGNSAEGAEVRFVILKGNGELIPVGGSIADPPTTTTVLSDEKGLAKVHVKFGTQSGVVMIQAYLNVAPSASILFEAVARPAAPAILTGLAGDHQVGISGHRLSQPLSVQINDIYGNPITGKTIEFSSPHSGHFNPSATIETDHAGVARVFWHLGFESGTQRAVASYQTLNPVDFFATAMTNQAPLVILPDSVQLYENQSWTLSVTATDVENDSFVIRVDDLPNGAQFSNDYKLIWRPDYSQAGRYELSFDGEDCYGAVSHKKLVINVKNINRPPLINQVMSQPPSQDVISLKQPGYIDLKVVAEDPDGDTLRYVWLVNNALRAVGPPQYRFQSDLIGSSDVKVKVIVSDRKDTTSLSWRFRIVTLVQLADYNVSAEPFKGITLNWRTALESGNLGFYLKRAEKAAGPFTPISSLLAVNEEREYSFIDLHTEPGIRYYYLLQNVGIDGNVQDLQTIQAILPLPRGFVVEQTYPNPFNASTIVSVSLPKSCFVQVVVHDVMGRWVKTIFAGEARGGYYEYEWNGKDEMGYPVTSGVYYCTIKADQERQSCKMVLIK